MKPGHLLRALVEAGIGIGWDEDGSAVLIDPDHKLTHSALLCLLEHRWLVDGAVLGVFTGHRWMSCDVCDEVALVSLGRSRQPRSCHLTARCTGTLTRVPLWLPKRPGQRTVEADPTEDRPRQAARREPPPPSGPVEQTGDCPQCHVGDLVESAGGLLCRFCLYRPPREEE